MVNGRNEIKPGWKTGTGKSVKPSVFFHLRYPSDSCSELELDEEQGAAGGPGTSVNQLRRSFQSRTKRNNCARRYKQNTV